MRLLPLKVNPHVLLKLILILQDVIARLTLGNSLLGEKSDDHLTVLGR
jgi:hypothetical protein